MEVIETLTKWWSYMLNSLLPEGIVGWILLITDIAIVSYIFYKAILLVEGTRAVQLLKGLLILLVFASVSNLLGLTTINWLLSRLELAIAVALPVVFQPEIRRALAQLGKGRLFSRSFRMMRAEDMAEVINEIVRAAVDLSERRTGALIVIERETGINDYIDTGIKLDGLVSSEILENIFVPNTPLHDGAVVIRGDRIIAASCFLPLSDSPYLSNKLGTRHRASLGISEVSDAVTIAVSEETGTISLSNSAKLTRYLDEDTLKKQLEDLLLTNNFQSGGFFSNRGGVYEK
jgi:diadenylate cyclase